MSDPITNVDGLFTLVTTTASTSFTLSAPIVQQTIYLIGYRVEVTDATAALACPIVYLDMPFLSPHQLIDGIPNRTYLPLALDNSKVTIFNGMNKPLYLNGNIPKTFDLVVRDGTNFLPLTSLVHIFLQWRTVKNNLG